MKLESKADFTRRMGWKNRSTATRYAESGKIVIDEKTGLVDVEASLERLKATADPLKEGVRQRHQRGRGERSRDRDDDGLRVDPRDNGYQLLTKHRAAAEYSRAELLRLELEEKEGRLVDAETVRKRAQQLARAARDAVLNLRYRVDQVLAGEQDPVKRGEIWDRELQSICEDLERGVNAPLAVASGSG